MVPTVSDLAEPMKDGKKMTLAKTWVSEEQLIKLVQNTPREQVYKRPGKGGSTFDYVTVSYVQRVLNFVFAWNWDFEIVEHGKEANHVWVLGKLTVKSPDGKHMIVKTQFGRSDVKQLKTGGNLDYGNDLKAASSDALKKCASLLGIASDIYGKAEYRVETGGQEPRTAPTAPQLPAGETRVIPEGDDLVCHGATKSGCGNDITQSEKEFTIRTYGKPLCRECMKIARPIKRK